MIATRATISVGFVLAAASTVVAGLPLGTGFTYQGRLRSAGMEVDDLCDFEFRMFDSLAGGVQIGPTLTFDGMGGNPLPVEVVEGLFTVKLDFGVGVFEGDARFLEIRVRCPSGVGGYVLLDPRQPLCATPYALYALDSPASFNLPLEVTLDYDGPILSLINTNFGLGLPSAFRGRVTDVGTAIEGFASGFGVAGGFFVQDPGSGTPALWAMHDGFGAAIDASNPGQGPAALLATGGTNPSNVLEVITNAVGRAGMFTIANPASAANALEATTNGSGEGVRGANTNPAGATIGVHGLSLSPNGTGVKGENTDPNGFGVLGVHGIVASSFGVAVRGEATSNIGPNYGVQGMSPSVAGTGVLGTASSATGNTYGVRGNNASSTGRGVFGSATSAAGITNGVRGEVASTTGIGVYGKANAANGANAGVFGETASVLGVAVKGLSTAANGNTFGVIGECDSNTATAVYGLVTSNNIVGERIGVKGEFDVGDGIAVQGITPENTLPTRAIQGINRSNDGQGGVNPPTFAVAVEGLATADNGVTRALRGINDSKNGIALEAVAAFNGDAEDVPSSVGVLAACFHARGTAVKAIHGNMAPSVLARGVYAEVQGPGTAIEARVQAGTGGGTAIEANGGNTAVLASGIQTGVDGNGTLFGVHGTAFDTLGVGVRGKATGGADTGVVGNALDVANGNGVIGLGTGVGVTGSGPIGVKSLGDLEVIGDAQILGSAAITGTLSKGGGAFKIDHPLDPENMYLYHSFVESPDMMNIYNGNVVTDGAGYADVLLPDWFESLNRDFRYQLTVIDRSDSESFVLAKVVREIEGNLFVIRTSEPRTEVSWQVTGVRHDAWARANRIPTEVAKDSAERGKYLHPVAWGLPAEMGVGLDAEDRKSAPRPSETSRVGE